VPRRAGPRPRCWGHVSDHSQQLAQGHELLPPHCLWNLLCVLARLVQWLIVGWLEGRGCISARYIGALLPLLCHSREACDPSERWRGVGLPHRTVVAEWHFYLRLDHRSALPIYSGMCSGYHSWWLVGMLQLMGCRLRCVHRRLPRSKLVEEYLLRALLAQQVRRPAAPPPFNACPRESSVCARDRSLSVTVLDAPTL
jgi:hypothetical protein